MLSFIRTYRVALLMASAIIFLILHHLFGFLGHFGFDDVRGYAFYAYKWMHSTPFYLDDNFFSYRWGVIGPLYIFYLLFGIHDFSSALPGSLFFLGHLYGAPQ